MDEKKKAPERPSVKELLTTNNMLDKTKPNDADLKIDSKKAKIKNSKKNSDSNISLKLTKQNGSQKNVDNINSITKNQVLPSSKNENIPKEKTDDCIPVDKKLISKNSEKPNIIPKDNVEKKIVSECLTKKLKEQAINEKKKPIVSMCLNGKSPNIVSPLTTNKLTTDFIKSKNSRNNSKTKIIREGSIIEKSNCQKNNIKFQKSNGFSLYSFKNSVNFAKEVDYKIASKLSLLRSKTTSPLQLPSEAASKINIPTLEKETNFNNVNVKEPEPKLERSQECSPVKSRLSFKSTNSDEILCRAFSVDRSVTLTAKANNSQQNCEAHEIKEYLDKSIKNDGNKALSFLNELSDNSVNNEEEKEIPQKNVEVKKKLRLRNPVKFERHENESINQKSNYLYHSSLIINNQSIKDVSLFSTQDSDPSKNKSLNLESFPMSMLDPPFSGHKYDIIHNQTLVSNNSFTENNNSELFMNQNIYNSISQGPGFYLDNFGFPKHLFPNMLQFDDEMQKKSRLRKCHPILNSKDFDIRIEKIFEHKKTTLMIKNIPNRYTKDMMLEMIDAKFKDEYNFFYLPIDFDNNCNVGYAFLNFIELDSIKEFYLEFNKKTWPHFKSDKIAEITYARIQGRDACIQHFKDSSLMKQQVV